MKQTRRNFLKFLSIAPVVAPTVASAIGAATEAISPPVMADIQSLMVGTQKSMATINSEMALGAYAREITREYVRNGLFSPLDTPR